jgi:hypothetical protein
LQKALGLKPEPVLRPELNAIETPVKTMLRRCPCCKKGALITLIVFDKRGPPSNYLTTIKKLRAKL